MGYCLFKLAGTPYIITIQGLEEDKVFLRKLIYNNAETCIVASSAIKEYCQKIGVRKIEIIPNGIDLNRFKDLNREKSREKLGLNDEFVVMTVARLEKVKGIRYLIRAIDIQNTKYKIPNTKYIIIGDGSERENLQKLTRELNLEDKVKFLGQIPNEQIPEYLVAADCFVLPSLKEGFGIVILEAMAASIPVIGTKVGGILDIIEDCKNGILVEPKNPEAIAEALLKIYSREELVQDLISKAKSNLEKYNWENIAIKVLDIYSHLNFSKNESERI